MKYIYIHVGYGKTGTTYLQNYFKNNKLYNLYYPNTFQYERHLYLSSINIKNFNLDSWKKLKKEIETIDENILISSEELLYDKKFINNLHNLQNLFLPRRIKIIITIDYYVNLIYKSYLEFISKYENDYVYNNIFMFIKNHKNSFIQLQIRNIQKKIGKENMILIPYQKEKYINIFCKHIGINNLKKVESKIFNPSLSIEYIDLLEYIYSNNNISKINYINIIKIILENNNPVIDIENYLQDIISTKELQKIKINLQFRHLTKKELIGYRKYKVNIIHKYINKYFPEIKNNYDKLVNNFKINIPILNEYSVLFHKYDLTIRNPIDPISYNIILKKNIDKKLICHIHCYNIDKFNYYFGDYITNIEKNFSVIITFSIGNKILKNYTILKIENRGVDIGSKLCFLKYIIDNKINYSHILFLHSKTNEEIRKKYFYPLVGSNTIISKNIDLLLNNDAIFNNIHQNYNMNLEYISNRYYHKEILDFLNISNKEEISYSEGNCMILSKKIIDIIFSDNLHIFYNILNSLNDFDLSWVRGRYGKKENDVKKLYNDFKNNVYYMDLNKNGISVGNNFGNKSNDMPDGMIEHIFERIYINVIKHLNLSYKVV